MITETQKKEKAFQEGLLDDTIRPDPSNSTDPKTSVTNQDKKITNEDEQKILEGDTDDHGADAEIIDEQTESTTKPDIDSTAFIIELAGEEKEK